MLIAPIIVNCPLSIVNFSAVPYGETRYEFPSAPVVAAMKNIIPFHHPLLCGGGVSGSVFSLVDSYEIFHCE